MSRLSQRVRRIAASRPPAPSLPPPFDPYRLTPQQMERGAELRERLLAVGPEGLTAEERADAEHREAILLAPDPPELNDP